MTCEQITKRAGHRNGWRQKGGIDTVEARHRLPDRKYNKNRREAENPVANGARHHGGPLKVKSLLWRPAAAPRATPDCERGCIRPTLRSLPSSHCDPG